MTPEEHRDAAVKLTSGGAWKAEDAAYHATMGILEALLQMEICGHGTRGFCKDCFWVEFRTWPISTKDVAIR